MKRIMSTLNVDEDMPIQVKMLTKIIESSQKKVEAQNYYIRKHVLEYDDVMNRQRELIYDQRNQVLNDVDLKSTITKMIDETIRADVNLFCPELADPNTWNIIGLRDKWLHVLTTEDDFDKNLKNPDLIELLTKRAHNIYEEKEEDFTSEIMRELERMVLLRNVDTYWMDHIDNMEELKKGIGLRAYAQKDPVVMFKLESFDMFDEMSAAIRENTVFQMLTVKLTNRDEVIRNQVAKNTKTNEEREEKNKPVRRKTKKVGPNDPCPCGSGKKYKKCCMLKENAEN